MYACTKPPTNRHRHRHTQTDQHIHTIIIAKTHIDSQTDLEKATAPTEWV